MSHLGWIAARAPNRVNRAHRPTKDRQNFDIFSIFPAHAKNCPRWAQMGPGGFFPTNPDLADILGRTDLSFENFYFLIFWTPHFWISRSPDLQTSGFPDLQIPTFPDFQVPRFPDAAAGAAAGRTLRSQPDPSANAPRDQIRRKGPCCDLHPVRISIPSNKQAMP